MTKQMPGGYNGKILRVNLGNNSVSVEEVDELFLRKYLGGAGFVSYFLLKELQPQVDPFSPDNKLIFALGPVTGILLPGSDRNCVGTKSALTGGIAKSEVGGWWGSELKRAGYDVIIIEGKAEKPVYLWIHDGEAGIRDARHLWGRNTKETQQTIRGELGDNQIRVASIGPAGENRVRYASIMNGLLDAAARGGPGAVMGSKNLKAVAVRGHKAPHISDPQHVRELRKWSLANMKLAGLSEVGTGGMMKWLEASGNLPIRNFRDRSFPGVESIDGQAMKNTIRIGMEGCYACPVRCKPVVKFEEPYIVDPAYGGPEYETLAALGSNCCIDNLKAIAKGAELCNAYSLDTISMGGVIAFAMECFERGLLSIKDMDGIELRFGNDEAMLKVIELTARREGIGDLLAEGTARAAQKIGNGAQEFAVQVKGLEAGLHEPRLKAGFGLGFMVNPCGADHACNMSDTGYSTEAKLKKLRPLLGILEPLPFDDLSPRKVALLKVVQLKQIINDSLLICLFFPYSYEQVADLTAAVTGWDTGITEQLRVAERILTAAKLFNVQQGITASDDILPQRFFQPKGDGDLAVKPLDPAKLEQARSYYYTLMGWDSHTGIPTPEKLEELGIYL